MKAAIVFLLLAGCCHPCPPPVKPPPPYPPSVPPLKCGGGRCVPGVDPDARLPECAGGKCPAPR